MSPSLNSRFKNAHTHAIIMSSKPSSRQAFLELQAPHTPAHPHKRANIHMTPPAAPRKAPAKGKYSGQKVARKFRRERADKEGETIEDVRFEVLAAAAEAPEAADAVEAIDATDGVEPDDLGATASSPVALVLRGVESRKRAAPPPPPPPRHPELRGRRSDVSVM